MKAPLFFIMARRIKSMTRTTQSNYLIKKYYTDFVHDGTAPFNLQFNDRNWFEVKPEKYSCITDNMIINHLDKKYWLACRGGYYPKYAYIDIDSPADNQIESVIDRMRLKEGQYLLYSSPDYMKDGSCHIYFKPRYNNDPPTVNLLNDMIKPHATNFEIYPQRYRKFRLPFGKDQNLIDTETGEVLNCTWTQNMNWCDKIDQYDMEIINEQLQFYFNYKRLDGWTKYNECKELYTHGLQAKSTRHEAIKDLSFYLYRQNIQERQAISLLKKWINNKHNGMSNTMNQGRFNEVYKDIKELVDWTYRKYTRHKFYSDMVNNQETGITYQDIEMISEVFPGSMVNQRRLFKLLSYYRPRSIFDWVYIPRNKWFDISGHRYIEFQQNLINKGLLQKTDHYKVGIFPKRFKINQFIRGREYMQYDKRNIDDYDTLLKSFDPEYLKNKLKLNRKAIYRINNNGTNDNT
jgi:hypothetical protein